MPVKTRETVKSREELQNGVQQHKFIIKNCYFNIKNGNPRYCSVAFVIPFYVINCAIQRTCEPQRVAVGRPSRYRFNDSKHDCLGQFANNPPTWIPTWTHRDTFEPPPNTHHENGKIDSGACGSLCKASHMHYMSGRLSLALWSSLLGHGRSPCHV